jgi:acetyl-CoA synthetase
MLQQFRWQVPRQMNIAQLCAKRWATHDNGQRLAVISHQTDAPATERSFAQLQAAANAMSQQLAALGVQRGDRVAVVLPQRFETAVAFMALWQMGAVVMPLSQLFGPEALLFRLQDAQAVLAVVDHASASTVQALQADCPELQTLLNVDDMPWHMQAKPWPMADTLASDPAVLIYTSGTTGPPKGALIPHRALIGNLTGFVCSQNGFGFAVPEAVPTAPARSDAVFWSPADWAWTGGLMDALLPTLYFGREIVAFQGRFAPERAFELLQRHGVTHSFLFPTALKAMMKAVPEPAQRYRLHLRAIMSAGEAVGDAVFAWCRDQLGVTVNEMFGQTEINYIVGNCTVLFDEHGRAAAGWPAKPGSMGRAYPGHRVAVIDDEGRECPRGTPGDVAVHRLDVHGHPDPVFFLGYWRNEAATSAKYTGDPADSWCRTGDMAVMDEQGYLWYQGRSDDMFKAAGYRIGPSEIENCLVKHPAVANAAVVPKPDAERGAVVKAYVVLAPGHAAGPALVAELQHHVRGKLAPYEYPKEIEFIAALPMTTTGKVQRRMLRLQEEERARREQPPIRS